MVINELLADPTGDETEDEYVELVNAGGAVIDLTGCALGDIVDPARHVFGALVLRPGEAVVVFGGGDRSAIANALTSSSGALSLNNGGDTVTLLDASGRLETAVSSGQATAGVSFNREVDGDGASPLVLHDAAVGAGGDRSPGTPVDGSAW